MHGGPGASPGYGMRPHGAAQPEPRNTLGGGLSRLHIFGSDFDPDQARKVFRIIHAVNNARRRQSLQMASRAEEAAVQLGCETSAVSTTRRPLGHGPAPLDEDQTVRTAQGRTAAERAAEVPQEPAPRTENAPSARRRLGAGPNS